MEGKEAVRKGKENRGWLGLGSVTDSPVLKGTYFGLSRRWWTTAFPRERE